MCGLTGFYDFGQQRRKSQSLKILQDMTASLRHRGPDQGDTWQGLDGALGFGHRRLSIVDLSPKGRQPMASNSGRYHMVYNGEIYNAFELRTALEDQSYPFKGHSDTEIFLAACDVWGVNAALQKINGMFAIVLWDQQDKKLHFIRDRFGKKPLYIGWAGDALIFGSELKSLRAHPGFAPQISQEASAMFFRYGAISAPMTIYQRVWQLPPAHRMTLDLNAPITTRSDLTGLMLPYWQATQMAKDARKMPVPASSETDMKTGFADVLRSCVQDRMISDVPLGAFLSGGIDSSLITALMQEDQSRPIKTFCIGFKEAGFDEAKYAAEIAQHLGTDHHEHYISAQDAMDVIPSLPDMYDEPFADISAIPTALVSQFARKHVTVALSGDGGDEMMAGYNRHVSGASLWAKLSLMPRPVRQMVAASIRALPASVWSSLLSFRPQAGSLAYKLASALEQDSAEGFYDDLCAQWKENPVKGAAVPSPLWHKEAGDLGAMALPEKMLIWDVLSYLPSTILTKVDRASMANSLEVRAPLLDPRVFDYAWRLPLSAKIQSRPQQGVKGKWLMRQLLKDYVPERLFDRPKQGFSMPVGAWLKTDLQDWAADLLSPETLAKAPWVDADKLRVMWKSHLKGQGHYDTQLWTALMYMAWVKRWG